MDKWLDSAYVAGFVDRARKAGYKDDEIAAHVAAKQAEAKQAAAASAKQPITARDVGRSLASGATLGFNDELAGLGAALVPGGKGYTEARDAVRANDRRFHSEHPVADDLLKVGGGLATALIPAGAAAKGATTLGQQVVAGAKLGAAFGAAAGLGNAEGPVKDQAESTALGAAGGAVTGAVIPAVAAGTRALGSGARRVLGIAPDAEATASRHIALALHRAKSSVAKVEDALATARREAPGIPVTIADVGGEPTRRLARGAASYPTEAAQTADETLAGRDMGRSVRLEGGITRTTGQERSDLPALLEHLDASFRPKAQQMYDRAYGALDNKASGAIDDPVINTLLDTPEIGEIWDAANKTYAVQRQLSAAAGKPLPDLVPIVEKVHTPQGDVWERTGKFPDTRTLDYLKRGMDAYIERRYAGPTANKGLAVAMGDVRKQLLNRLDEINPAYREARGFYKGGLDTQQAVEAGQKALGKSRDEIAADLRGMSTFEQNAYKLAAQDALRQRLRSPGGVTAILNPKNRELRERVQMIFPSEKAYQAFIKQVQQEANLTRTERMVLGGSPTQRIAAEQADLNSNPTAQTVLQMAQQGPRNALLINAISRVSRLQMSEATADRIAAKLLTVDPNEQQVILAKLTAAERAAVGQAMRRRTARLTAAATVGGLLPRAGNRGAQ